PPRYELVDVGIAGGIADALAFDSRPGRRADDLARLRLNVAEADLLVFAAFGQMAMVAAGRAGERLPGLDRDIAVGLGCQIHDHLGSIDVAVDPRPSFGGTLFADGVIES